MMNQASEPASRSNAYADSGVDVTREQSAMAPLLAWVKRTAEARPSGPGRACLGVGHFAEVIEIGRGLGLALSCDGVGTKLLVAQLLDRYDSVGIDLVAMSVNDLLCVGAEPLAFLDYVAVEQPDPELFDGLGKGLHAGAMAAGVVIAGGEVAQVGELIRGARPGRNFELAGFAVGTVALDSIIDGSQLVPGDVVLGLPSSGIHSNGLSLARKLLLPDGAASAAERPDELEGQSVGDALLEPTAIYVKPIKALWDAGISVHALAHITGDGLLNLHRVAAPVGFIIDSLPEPPGIFQLLEKAGRLPPEELYTCFNMGLGMCVSLPAEAVDRARSILSSHGISASVIGRVTDDPKRRVQLPALGLSGNGRRFERN